MRRSKKFKDGLSVVGVVLLAVAIIAFGFFSFKNCYDDHRNQLGFGVWTSIQSCSS